MVFENEIAGKLPLVAAYRPRTGKQTVHETRAIDMSCCAVQGSKRYRSELADSSTTVQVGVQDERSVTSPVTITLLFRSTQSPHQLARDDQKILAGRCELLLQGSSVCAYAGLAQASASCRNGWCSLRVHIQILAKLT